MLTVTAGLLRERGLFLICRRRPDQEHAGKWEFPGGKVELGEDPRQALARELREELRIEAEIGEEFLRYEFAYPGKRSIRLIFYWIDRWSGAIDDSFFAETRWAQAAGMRELDFLAGDERVIAELASRPFA